MRSSPVNGERKSVNLSGIRLYMHAHPFRRFPADKGKNLGNEKFR